MSYVFVGERPSPTALRKGWTLKDGRLAGKQLFDALMRLGLNPQDYEYDNLFIISEDKRCYNAVRRVKRRHQAGLKIVAMGVKVAYHLERLQIPHLKIPHPAARGRIRKKSRYTAAVKEGLWVELDIFTGIIGTSMKSSPKNSKPKASNK